MKIDPTDKQLQIKSPNKDKPIDGAEVKGGDFASILGKTVKNSPETPIQISSPSVRSLNAPKMHIHQDYLDAEFKAANGLLDALEDYQKQLENPNANLKVIEPMVKHMAALFEETDSIVHQMPDSHPVKTVAQEALMHMAKEIERFNAGHYVDE